MAVNISFNPHYGSGAVVSPAATSASTLIGDGQASIVLTNLGDNVCYVRVGNSTVTATTSDYPVLAGQQVSLTKFQDHTHIAHISADGTSLHVITGEGM